MSNNPLNISEFTRIIKNNFEMVFPNGFTIVGEVQNLSDKKHYYFSLKDIDNKTTIKCIMWKGTKDKNNYTLQNGDVITVKGKLGIYELNNSYSFTVFKMIKEQTQETDFQRKYRMFEEKKYFEKKLPVDLNNIQKVALVTSLQGEALHDFKRTLQKRFFYGNIYQYDVAVQGVNCATDVIKAIDFFEKSKKYKPDIILITRGGGSTIDLDEFNDVDLIERIYQRKIPIGCAIGHERDFSLCDYACDLRSSTPTMLAMDISNDSEFIESKLQNLYNEELQKYNKARTSILLELNDKRSYLNNLINDNKPTGFYFNNKYITNVSDFKKVCNEVFTIQLTDGIIEFQIDNFKIKENNLPYAHKDYLLSFNGMVNTKTYKQKYSIEEYILKLNEEKFGSKKHYQLFMELLTGLNNDIQVLNNLDEITEIKNTYNGVYKNSGDMIEYKKYINNINNIITTQKSTEKSSGFNKSKMYDYYNEYINYPRTNGITKELLTLYHYVKQIKPKYYVVKINSNH